MVKISSSDIVAILRRYDVASDDTARRQVEQIKITNPLPTNTMAGFRFNRTQYYILFDDTAEDNTAYVTEQVRTSDPSAEGELLVSPLDSTTYALPFKGKDVYLFAVKSAKKRLDNLLAARYPEYSRSTWQKFVKAGCVQVNGVVQLSPKFEVAETDSIALSIPEAADHSGRSLPILYLDDNIVVVNKPIGVLSHTKGALSDEFTVADFFARFSTYHQGTNRPGIVHRLDRDTSGVMIGARTPEAAASLQAQFAQRKAKKTYIAVLAGVPKLPAATIDLPIGRNPAAPSRFRVDPKGKPAQTSYEIDRTGGGRALVRLQPHTGRTHQLRVHMSHLGTPILGDRIYGAPDDRLYLHAQSLEITIPGGERKVFSAPVPEEFDEKVSK